MEQSPFQETNNHSASPEIHLLWNPKVHYSVHKISQWSLLWAKCIQSTPSHPISLTSFLILSSNLCLVPRSGHFPSGIPTKILCAFLISPVCFTCTIWKVKLLLC